MKSVLKGEEPSTLATYRTINPNNTWEQFRSSPSRRSALRSQLIADQGGLCVYCEINLRIETVAETSDFRVEHFHPKSDTSDAYNWGLDWQNLFGCCHGGSSKLVVDGRFNENSLLHSCDVPKGDSNWDNKILNPLQIPTHLCLFIFERADGSMAVNSKNCSNAVELYQAKGSVEKLNLNSERLTRMRKEILNHLSNQLIELSASGVDLDKARDILAQSLLVKNNAGHWPAFFSAIRYYLGQSAEDHLRSANYQG